MSVSRLRNLGLMITSLWLFVGCSDAKKIDVGGACALSSDCNQGLVCTWGKCHDPCHTSADCPAGQSCITAADQSKVCQLPVEMHCVYNSDCQNPLACAVDQRCHNQCQTSADCISGQTCTTTKTCAEPSQVDSKGNLIPADGGVSGSGGTSGDGGSISPDALADRPADVAGSTGGTGGRDSALGAGGSISAGRDAPQDLPADVSGSIGGTGSTGGIAGTGAIIGAGGITSAGGGVTGSGGTPGTGGSTGPNPDASASPPTDVAGTPNGGDAPGTTNDSATSDTSSASSADGPSVTDSASQTDAPLFITSFTASATTISMGSSVTLSWTVGTGATLISIDNGIGMVTPTGSRLVFPTQTTTYILTAADGAGHYDTAQVTVTVMPIDASVDAPVGGAGGGGGSGGAGGFGGIGGTGGHDGGLGGAGGGDAGLPVINSFVAGARIVTSGVYALDTGHATTLTATFSNATSAKVDPGFPSVTSGAAVPTGTLAATTTYTLTVTNAVGSVTATLTVQVFPTPVTVATVASGPVLDIAVDSSNVFWATSGYPAGSLMKVASAGGGTPVTLASWGASQTYAIALDTSNVYWANYTDGTVMKVALAGGDTPTTLASGQDHPKAITVGANTVYWANYSQNAPDGGTLPVPGTGSVVKVAVGGSGLATLASGQDGPDAVAVDGTSVYWNGRSADIGASLMKVAVGGGSIATLAVGLTGVFPPIAVDANGIYWQSGIGIVKMALTGGSVVPLVASGAPNGVAIDDTNLYWVDQNQHDVMKVPLVGGTPVLVALGSGGATVFPRIAIDATSVYWFIGSTILKTAK